MKTKTIKWGHKVKSGVTTYKVQSLAEREEVEVERGGGVCMSIVG